MSEAKTDAAAVAAAAEYRYQHWDELAANATMPTCPPWCVDCQDLSSDIPGSRLHNGVFSPRIPAHVQIGGCEDYMLVRSSFHDMYPPLRLPVESDRTGCVELCLGEDSAALLLPQDARRLAEEILKRVDEIEHTPDTRTQSV
jgi:hypothetical protein